MPTRSSPFCLFMLALSCCLMATPASSSTFHDEVAAFRPAPDRDQVSHTGTARDGEYSSETSRLSGHYEARGDDGRFVVHGSYLLGDRDTRETARRLLTERLKQQALEKAGVYHAFEERLTARQRLTATSVLVSGGIVTIYDVQEEMRSVGHNQVEMRMQASASVDNSGLQQHIEALFDNHALAAANAHLQQENQRLRQHQATFSRPHRGDRAAASVNDPAASYASSATMVAPAYAFVSDGTPWLKDINLLHERDWVTAFGYPCGGGAGKPCYRPEGAGAIPQNEVSAVNHRSALMRAFDDAVSAQDARLQVRVDAQERTAAGVDYRVTVSGFRDLHGSLLAATELPFVNGELRPEQIADLNPWSALTYWAVADQLARQPLVLTVSAHGDIVPPGRQVTAESDTLASLHQPVLVPVMYNHDRSRAQIAAFSPLENLLWYLGGQHLSGLGLKAPVGALSLDGVRNESSTIPTGRHAAGNPVLQASREQRARARFRITDFDPQRGELTFYYASLDREPSVTNFSASLHFVDSDALFSLPLTRGNDGRRQLGVREATSIRVNDFF